MGFFQEFRRSWLTSCIGLGLFCFGTYILTSNEGRAVGRSHSLDEAYKNVLSVNPYDQIKPEYEGRLVHISGLLLVDEPLTDQDYGVSVQAVKMKRRVQMYQWVEERKGSSGFHNTELEEIEDYYYFTEWRDKVVDSNSFYMRYGHQNPSEIPLKKQILTADTIRVGHLLLGHNLKEKFTEFIEITGDERPDRSDVKLHLGIYYHSDDVWNPEVGDIRVQFYYAGMANEPVSIIAKQENGVLVPYQSSKDHKIAFVREGVLNIVEMLHREHSDANFDTWKMRGVGLFILYASVTCLSRLITILVINIPLLRNMLRHDFSISNLGFSASVSGFIMASAWFFYRPFLGTLLFAGALSPFLYCTFGVYHIVNAQNGDYNRL